MVSLPKSRTVPMVVVSFLLMGGCANYSNNWDSVTSRAGNASEANTAIQEITAWPPNVENTTVHGGG